MLISIDAHAIGCRLTGNEVYVSNLIRQFTRLDASTRFHLFISHPDIAASLPGCFDTTVVSTNPFQRLGLDIPGHLRANPPDLLHVQYTSPLSCRIPLVVTIHDVSFLEHPEYFRPLRALQLRWTVGRTARRAAYILTPSEFTKRAIMNAYDVEEGRVQVIPNGVSDDFRPIDRTTAALAVKGRFGVSGPYILTIGDLVPRKNHIGLIRAFEQMARARPELPHRLVVVGKPAWFAPRVWQAAADSPLRDRIHFTGLVPDGDLPSLYGAADVVAYPSFYEGFGLPVVEAMACGRAVVCSENSAIPEVANRSALLFDPKSPEAIAHALESVLMNPDLRGRLERLGLRRAKGFTWTRTARQTLDAYYRVAGEHRAATTRGNPARSVLISMSMKTPDSISRTGPSEL